MSWCACALVRQRVDGLVREWGKEEGEKEGGELMKAEQEGGERKKERGKRREERGEKG